MEFARSRRARARAMSHVLIPLDKRDDGAMHFSPTYARRSEDVATMVATRPGRATTPVFPTLSTSTILRHHIFSSTRTANT